MGPKSYREDFNETIESVLDSHREDTIIDPLSNQKENREN